MLYTSDINQLLSKWEAGLDNHSSDYKIGVRDCIYDIQHLITESLQEEALEEEAFYQQLSDSYLSTIEAHDALLCS